MMCACGADDDVLSLIGPADVQKTTFSDDRRQIGQPCLSHLTFKIIGNDLLSLTVLYRSHYYVERVLGNFIGLSQLLAFVATETDLRVGPLVCHSSYAKLESGKGWSSADVIQLLAACSGAIAPDRN